MSRSFIKNEELVKEWFVSNIYSVEFENWWAPYCLGKNEITLDKGHCWNAWCAALSHIDETITILPADRRQ